jgi:nucleoside-diphosphate-sugar epimerase
MEYFVTGATGFVGGHVARQLLEDGHEVVALARTPSAATDLETAGARVVEGDITDSESMRDPMTGVDGVFHVAGWYDVGADDPTVGERVNVSGTRTVLELMADLDVPKGVYTSTLAVNSDTDGQLVDEDYTYVGPHLTEYDRTKWAAHYEVARPMVADGLPLVTVMPGLVYGPGDTSVFGDALRDFLRGEFPVVPREVAYCPGHVEDIARAHVRAMEHGTPGEDYIVGGGPVTLVELFELVAELSGRDPPRTVSPWLFRVLAPVAGLLERVVTLPKDYRAESLRVLAGVTYVGDNAKATAELGLEHRPLREGLRETVEYELAHLSR